MSNAYVVAIPRKYNPISERKKKPGVFVKHECPRRQQSPLLAIFIIKVTVKVIDIGVI